MIDTLEHVGLLLAVGIIGTGIAIVWLIEGVVGLGMIVVAVIDRVVR
jgi:hypothetical protein